MDSYFEKIATLLEMFRDTYRRGAIIGFDDEGRHKGGTFETCENDLDYGKLRYNLEHEYYLQTELVLYNGAVITSTDDIVNIEDKIVIALGDYIKEYATV